MAAIALRVLLGGDTRSFALSPSLDASQCARTAWTFRDGFSTGNIFAVARTPDDAGLGIETVQRGLIHVHDGRTDAFTKLEGFQAKLLCASSTNAKAITEWLHP